MRLFKSRDLTISSSVRDENIYFVVSVFGRPRRVKILIARVRYVSEFLFSSVDVVKEQ